ncbi:MAG: ATP-binding protein [Candidatus Acidiferrales bacterium]
MTFADFVGNARGVGALRRMMASERVPHALLFAGQKGVGKFTLATLFARALNCERTPGEICGQCHNCRTLAVLEDLPALVATGLEARGSANPEEVPLLLRPHPSVTVLVPDGAFIRVAQMRHVVRQAYTMAAGARHQVFLIDEAERLRFDFADVLLKVLEEPPARTTLILVSSAPFELRPTIRSRCIPLYFSPLKQAELESTLQVHRPHWKKGERELAAAAAGGSLGTALTLDLERFRRVRQAALELVRSSLSAEINAEALFAATALLAGKEAQAEGEGEKPRAALEFSLDILYALLRDILHWKVGVPELGLHSPDLRSELQTLSREASWGWFQRAVTHLDRIEGWQRRNVSRQLALDAWPLGLARPE